MLIWTKTDKQMSNYKILNKLAYVQSMQKKISSNSKSVGQTTHFYLRFVIFTFSNLYFSTFSC